MSKNERAAGEAKLAEEVSAVGDGGSVKGLRFAAGGLVVAGAAALTAAAVQGDGPDPRPLDDKAAMIASHLHGCTPEKFTGSTGDDLPRRFLCDDGRYELVVSSRPDGAEWLAKNPGFGETVVKAGWNWIVVNAPAVPANAPVAAAPMPTREPAIGRVRPPVGRPANLTVT